MTGSGAINTTVDLPPSTTATFTVTADIDPAATGTLDNTVVVTTGPGCQRPRRPGGPHGDRQRHTRTRRRPVDHQGRRRHVVDPRPAHHVHDRRAQRRSVGRDGRRRDRHPPDRARPRRCGVALRPPARTVTTPPAPDDISTTVDLLVGGEATFTLTADIDPTALGTLSNTAGVTPPIGTTDPDTGDQTATDTNTLASRPPICRSRRPTV